MRGLPSRHAERLYEWLLRVYPARFRRRFAPGMREAFRSDLASSRQAGRAALYWFWVLTVAQAVWFGAVERGACFRRPTPSSTGDPGGSGWRFACSVDWRDAWRSLRATPVVTLVALLSLGLGIGANTALFSILDSLMLRPLPVADPDRLVLIERGSWTNPIWEQIRARERQLFDGAFAWGPRRFDLSSGGETRFVEGAFASAGMFDVLGMRPALGRTFTAADDARGGGPDGPVAVISHGFWQRHFGGAPDVVGRSLTLSRAPFTVVGVTPRGFFGPDVGRQADVFIPIGTEPFIRGEASCLEARGCWWLAMMARLRPGQTIEEATAGLRAVQPQIREATLPDWTSERMLAGYLTDPMTVTPGSTGRSGLRGRYRDPLTAIMVVVGAVLLVACGNIANLLLARATARRRELSLRLALGASRMRLARQLLAESLLLAGAGASLGLLLADWTAALLVSQLQTFDDPLFLDLSLNWRVLAFTGGAAIITALGFGLAPAGSVARVAPLDALREHGRGGVTGGGRFGLRNALVVAQVAFSVVLLVTAGLFLRSFIELTTVPLGFDAGGVLTIGVDVHEARVEPDARAALFARLGEAAAGVPGVERAALSVKTPGGDGGWNAIVDAPGDPALPERQRLAWVNAVTPGWFDAYGMRVLTGRNVEEGDTTGGPLVMIVNEAFARRYFGEERPVGRDVTTALDRTASTYRVIGIVSDAVYQTQRDGMPPTVYVPLAQSPFLPSEIQVTVRGAARPGAGLTRDVVDALHGVDAGASLTPRLIESQLADAVTVERLVARLSGFFGALALLLAALGLYGVTSYSVARRRAEIGVRMALGADPGGVVRLVLGRVAALVATGAAAGVLVSLWAAKYVAALLFGLNPRDPATLTLAVVVLAACAGLAGWLPARRAARLDPVRVLREG
jgi:predicted permease